MASGNSHDRASIAWCIPFGLCTNLIIGHPYGVLATFSFLIGGLWLSPDLDTHSRAFKRWGFLKIIWLPYQKFIPHRSILSHGPIIGTTLRILYLSLWIILISAIMNQIDFLSSIDFIKSSLPKFNINKKHIISLFLGFEGSTWLHLIQDGDPMPSELKKFH